MARHTLTAPGNKVWTYTYNALGQPTLVNIPNGMTTEYGYDARNRLTGIHHKDGATVVEGWDYTLSPGGNITQTDQADGSYWAYDYDGRGRLTTADRYEASGNGIHAAYAYDYDYRDNLLTKTEPFLDDFEDANATGWSTSAGWSASNGYMAESVSYWTEFNRANDKTVNDFLGTRLVAAMERIAERSNESSACACSPWGDTHYPAHAQPQCLGRRQSQCRPILPG